MSQTAIHPYLVIPKLIEQPTWGGTYIAETKQWHHTPALADKKIGQSYELYEKSNLSLQTDSSDPGFVGEIADNKSVEEQSHLPSSIPLPELIAQDPTAVLGTSIVDRYGPKMHLLLKFTQALGNSFQLHVPDGAVDKRWKPKPESWYFFEPGLMTCGVKKGVDWEAYKNAVTLMDREMIALSGTLSAGEITYEIAQARVAELLKKYDPWQYVNVIRVESETLVDLSPCGIHHSWEEDLATIPLGNVLYEIQLNEMDDVSSIRSFDKGKIGKDGKLRPLHINDYFTYADRSPEANDPATHMRKSTVIERTDAYVHERLLESKYYFMDKVVFTEAGKNFVSTINTFRHVFVRSGAIELTGSDTTIRATAGHSIFVPAGCATYSMRSTQANTEVLISY